MKRVLFISFMISLMISIVGCKHTMETDNETISQQETENNKAAPLVKEEQIEESLLDEDSDAEEGNLEDINEVHSDGYNRDKNHLMSSDVSPNGKYRVDAYWDTETDDRWADFIDLEANKLVLLDNGLPCHTKWSSDSNYFIVDHGTGFRRAGDIYKVGEDIPFSGIGYCAGIWWITEEDILMNKPIDGYFADRYVEIGGGTTNITRHNIVTSDETTIFKGTDHQYYLLESSDEDIPHVARHFVSDNMANGKMHDKIIYKDLLVNEKEFMELYSNYDDNWRLIDFIENESYILYLIGDDTNILSIEVVDAITKTYIQTISLDKPFLIEERISTLSLEDANFDSIGDIGILRERFSGSNVMFDYWVWSIERKEFIYDTTLSNLISPLINPSKKEIYSMNTSTAGSVYDEYTYSYIKGKLEPTKYLNRIWDNDFKVFYYKLYTFEDGKMTLSNTYQASSEEELKLEYYWFY